MVSSASSSPSSSPFDRLHPEVKRWIWDQEWQELREVQSLAIEGVLGCNDDLIIAAATAAGKTEAAFLPILSRVADATIDSFAVLYISPLKALINDQFRRLEALCERLSLPVVKWHGDAAAAAKAKALRHPRGVVLITPESIESLLVRRGPEVRRLVGETAFIVIDELHAFMSGERGVHLASLLKRLEAQAGRPIRKIGLSATIGDYTEAKRFLRPDNPDAVREIKATSVQADLRLQVRCYREPKPAADSEGSAAELPQTAQAEIEAHLFRHLRGSNNLVFASSRKFVETYAAGLSSLSEATGVPNEFFPHHGSLAKGLREELEERLKKNDVPTTAVATTTLELGIDIGSVVSVAQIGPPASIAGLRQRVGRSGRRAGQPSILRIYVTELDEPADNDLFTWLRCDTVQSVAAVRLLVEPWIERGLSSDIGFSTLLHQVLALIRERGGARAKTVFDTLCGAGPFASMTPTDFAALLNAMGATTPPLLEQAGDGTLMLGALGEQVTDRYDFYAVFMSDEEFRIVTEHRALGTIPIFNPLRTGDYIIFAGRRWIVEAVDDKAKVIRVAAAPAGRVPKFQSQEGAPLDDRLVEEMRKVYRSSDRPVFLDAEAWNLLQEGRTAYAALELDRRSIVAHGDDVYIFHWHGTRAAETLRLALAHRNIRTEHDTVGLRAPSTSIAPVTDALKSLRSAMPSAAELAASVETLHRQKFDHLIPDELLRLAFARSRLDVDGLRAALANIVL